MRRTPSTTVTIVSSHRETVDGLQEYFGRVGVSSRALALGSPEQAEAIASHRTTATVIFPDDFAEVDVLGLVRALRAKHPRRLVLLVTREPQRFRATTVADGRSEPAVILPKPSFGWDLLDVIRAHAAGTRA
jgi:hypothetical protein